MNILNLYAGIGGNRKLWHEEHSVTAVENNSQIAEIYQKNFPQDKVIVSDAHRFLLEHFDEFDFIWSSPPCPSHSRMRQLCVTIGQNRPLFPSMILYEEILFCQQYVKCKWVIENVISWYEPLIKPFVIGRHYFWSNFIISNLKVETGHIRGYNYAKKEKISTFKLDDVKAFKGQHKEKLLNNCTEPILGLHVFNCAFKFKQQRLGLEK